MNSQFKTLASSTPEERRDWVREPAVFTESELLIRGFQVMQAWETGYMRRLAEVATSRGGTVLEVGFGLGLSAAFIQEAPSLDSHVVIEAHPEVAAKARMSFAEAIRRERLTVVEGFWEQLSPEFPAESFDGILFDTCPLSDETVFFHYTPFFGEAHRLLKRGGVFTYFSDEPERIGEEHAAALRQAGFVSFDWELVSVEPPSTCRYWQHKSIVVPVVRK
jgi:guanidinoacetate N-methyltransferase